MIWKIAALFAGIAALIAAVMAFLRWYWSMDNSVENGGRATKVGTGSND